MIDTSVFLNILDLPGRNQDRQQVLDSFQAYIQNEDTLLLPYAVIIETGNFVGQTSGNRRFDFAQKFTSIMVKCLEGNLPWKPLRIPQKQELLSWLSDFPRSASRGLGFADFSMVQELYLQRELFPQYEVQIWSLDQHLQGY
ncbi:MAG: hypothetical protein AAF399_15330 [Bacteroidota bacterium]